MDEKARKAALRLVPYGLYAVTCGQGDQANGFTASWLTQCSFDPPLLVLGVQPHTTSYQLIKEGGCFVVNFVDPEQAALLQMLLKPVARVGNKLAGQEIVTGQTGVPILQQAVAWLECRVVAESQPGDHALFVAEVVEAGRPSDRRPLVLSDTPWTYAG
ncbi:MAG: flavin reductase family protein [Fimbriimonadaceae bacterium]|nr:flavin reductase family protein [Fimbriimonadaceae bacterium]